MEEHALLLRNITVLVKTQQEAEKGAKSRKLCSVAQSCPTLWDTMDCSMPAFPVLPALLELAWRKALLQLQLSFTQGKGVE